MTCPAVLLGDPVVTDAFPPPPPAAAVVVGAVVVDSELLLSDVVLSGPEVVVEAGDAEVVSLAAEVSPEEAAVVAPAPASVAAAHRFGAACAD